MSKPETSIFPIEHGKLTTDLDAAGLQILNLDTSNLPGGSGNDTGTTTAILKGDGDHGFADAVADVDYASVASVSGFETSASHDADIATINTAIDGLLTADTAIIDALADKADSDDVVAGLALKENITSHDADITAIEGDITTIESDLATLTTAVGNKADSASVSAALAGKEPLLPTTVNDSYVLARHNAGGTDQWFFVDPVTLGSTNASYGDGATHSNTTFNSTLAVFTADDTGKTIVCAGNIPTDTTITFVNASTVTLSNAATTTASGLTFTILNRFLPSGSSGGTVTSVAINNNATALLSIPAVANSTTTPTITINSATPAAHTFYGNNSGVAAVPIFMDAATARNNLGGTVVGQAIFQVSSIGVFSYVRVNADNTVTLLNRTSTVSDLGVENALTFSSPLTRTINAISIPAAASSPAQINGYLTGADHAAFTAKIGTSTNIITTAPLQIAGASGAPGVNLSTTRTIAMPLSTGNADGTLQVDGYLSGADHTLFANKPPNSRTLAVLSPLTMSPGTAITGGIQGDLSANRTISMPKATVNVDGYLASADFGTFSSGSNNAVQVNAGPITINSSASPRINKIFVTAALSARMDITLPLAGNYGASLNFPSLEIIDISSGGHSANGFGIRLIRQSTDLINGSTAPLDLPLNIGYVRLNSDGGIRWTTTKYYVQSLTNPTNIAGTASFTTSGLTAARTINVPDANSTLVVPTDSQAPGVLLNVNTDGTVIKGQLNPTNLVPFVYSIGQAGVSLSGSADAVPDTGGYDTVWIAGSVTGAYTITLPHASLYNQGETLTFVDVSGSLSATTPITIAPAPLSGLLAANTINGSTNSVTLEEPFGRKLFTSDSGTNWSVSAAKAITAQGFRVITGSGGTFTLPVDSGVGKQNAHLNLGNGANVLAIPNPFDGMSVELVLKQPSSGARGTLSMPVGSRTAGGTAGIITLTDGSTTPSAIDRLRGSYVNNASLTAFLWDAPILLHTSAALPAAPSLLAVTASSSSSVTIGWTDNATDETGFDVQRATGVGGTFSSITTKAANVVTHTDTTVAGNVFYSYKVAAQNSGGTSAYSNTVTVTTPAACSTAGDTNGTGATSGAGFASGTGSVYWAGRFTPTTGNTSICRIDVGLTYVGNYVLGQTITLEVRADSGSGSPATGAALGTSASVPVTAIPISATFFDGVSNPTPFLFSPTLSVTANTNYWVVAHVSTSNSANHPVWANQSPTGFAHSFKSIETPITWIDTTSVSKLYIKTYH